MKTVPALTLLAVLLAAAPAAAVDEYISSPGRVPNFHDFRTPVIEQGKSGNYSFSITNRYEKTMQNLSLSVEIYGGGPERPYFPSERIGSPSGAQEWRPELAPGGSWAVNFTIETSRTTPIGTYFVRHSLWFGYNGTNHNMVSRGYISPEEWRNATAGVTDNLTYLNISGILPDSGFSVKAPAPSYKEEIALGRQIYLIWASIIGTIVVAVSILIYLRKRRASQVPPPPET